jgi:hypothetical protein
MYDLERLKFLLVTIDICAALSVGQNMASGKTRIASARYIRTRRPGSDMRRIFNQKALMGVGEVNRLQRSRDAAEGARVVKGLIPISGRPWGRLGGRSRCCRHRPKALGSRLGPPQPM